MKNLSALKRVSLFCGLLFAGFYNVTYGSSSEGYDPENVCSLFHSTYLKKNCDKGLFDNVETTPVDSENCDIHLVLLTKCEAANSPAYVCGQIYNDWLACRGHL